MRTDAIATTAAPAVRDTPELPDDVSTLQAMVREALAALAKSQQRTEQLEHRLDQLLRRMYGQKSEKLDPAQLLLFVNEASGNESVTTAAAETAPLSATESETITRARAKGHGRAKLPADLPRVRQEHDLTEPEKLCPCCQAPRTKIGEDVSEQLEYVPASLFVIQHVRPRYACPTCRDAVVAAAKPESPIAKGLPGPGLLAHVAVSKYADHLPLHRQERILARHGVELSRTTLCDWMRSVADLLRPLVTLMREQILKSALIQTDDTPVDVQDGPGKTREARLWVYRGDQSYPFVAFDFTPTHQRAGPRLWLGDYRGYLQADAYSGYNELFRTNAELIEVGCWAHARRYFFESQQSDAPRALQALAWIRELYDVERKAAEHEASLPERDGRHRLRLRTEKSRPLLDAFQRWLIAQQPRVLPQSPIGKAVQYALNQWTALVRYLEDAALPIDNNASERELRTVAIGRNNWLFCGSDRGGHTAAIIYSVLATCRRHNVEPFAYIQDLLTRLPALSASTATIPADQLPTLLPHVWQPLPAAR
jgi:transposase